MRFLRTTLSICMAVGVFAFVNTTPAHAQKGAMPKYKVLVSGLDNPCGVAVQPGAGHVYVAAHDGVYWINPAKAKKRLVIKGFKTDIYGKGPKYKIGPLGLDFMGKNHLVVGDGGQPDGSELVYIFKLRDKVQTPADAVHTLGPIKASKKTAKGEGNFYAVAIGRGGIFVSCNGDDTKGWVARSSLEKDTPGPLEPYIATKVATNVDAPVPITFSKDGKLVVGQMGEINLPYDSLLTFYNPSTGKLLKKFKTKMNDVTGLAYSPKTGKLYATDFSWMAPKKGGLFRLDVEGDTCKTVRLRTLDRPTALAFDSSGNLYVTVFGTGKKKQGGAVLKFGPGL